MFGQFKTRLKQHPALKRQLLNCLIHPIKTRPRGWLRTLQFLYIQKSRGAVIYHSVRKDLVPFNRFSLGRNSVIESFSTLNNQVGDIIIGDYTRVGLHNTIIGPVTIGNHTNLAQNITVSGLNHNFENPHEQIDQQGVKTNPIHIEDDVWIGANAVILPGVTIGRHAIVAAGSIVTQNVPSYSICAGNPARMIKQYDFNKKEWIKIIS